MNNTLDRAQGSLVGVGIGDALGAPLEFMTKQEIRQIHGYVAEMIGGGVWEISPGQVTDDTNMTIAVARGILTDHQNPVMSNRQ